MKEKGEKILLSYPCQASSQNISFLRGKSPEYEKYGNAQLVAKGVVNY